MEVGGRWGEGGGGVGVDGQVDPPPEKLPSKSSGLLGLKDFHAVLYLLW